MKTSIFSVRSRALSRLAAIPLLLTAAFPVWAQSNLGEVFVTASRSEQSLESAPIGSSVILGDEIRRSGVLDANEAIRFLGGVASRRDLNGGREATLDLRGYGDTATSNVVVLIDGVRISENELLGARLSAISPEMIDRIEIVRGGSSVLWGEGASAGVINVLTKGYGASQGVKGSVVLGVESFDGRDVRSDIYVGSSAMAFSAQVRSYRTDGYRQNSQHSDDSANVGVTFGDKKTLKTKISAFTESVDMRWPGALPLTTFLTNPRQTNTPNDFGEQRQSRWTVSVEKELSNALVTVDFARRGRTAKSFEGASYGNTLNNSDSVSYQLSPRVSWTNDWGTALLNTVVGLDWSQWDYSHESVFIDPTNSASSALENGRQTSRAAYVRTDLSLASQWRLNAGLRSERFQRSLDNVTYNSRLEDNPSMSAVELGVSRLLSDRWTAYTRMASSYRVANVDELRYLSKPLTPQQAKDFEIGARYRQDVTMAGVRVFQQRTRNEIAYDNNTVSNVNLDPVRRRGVEIEVSTSPSPRLRLSATAQTVNARMDEGIYAGKALPLAAQFNVLIRANYVLDASNNMDIVLRSVGSAPFGNDWKNACAMKIPAANFVDFGYRFQSSTDRGWVVRFGINNVLNKQSYSTGYTNAGCTAYNVYPDIGRSLTLSAGYSFR